MVEFNNDDKFRGVPPDDAHVLTPPNLHVQPRVYDGLYYRSDLQIDIDEAQARLLNRESAVTLQDYQYWAETAWRVPHGSYSAVEKFSDKLYEEHRELNLEYRALFERNEDRQAEILKESGDVLWCASALACVSNADINAGMKLLLYRYVSGVQHIGDHNKVIEAPWRQTAAELSTKFGQITVAGIDRLISAGFEPLPSPVMNIFDPDEDEGDVPAHLLSSVNLCVAIRSHCERQFGYGEWPDDDYEVYVLDGAFKDMAKTVGELVAGLYLEIVFMLQKSTGKTLADALSENVRKISSRIVTSTIDKSLREIEE